MNSQKKGFTLIELLIVLALIAILAGILIVVIKPAEIFKKGRDTKRQSDLRNISTAVENFSLELSNNPGSLNWPERGNCSGGTATGNIFFSIATASFPGSWPSTSSYGNISATGTTGINVDGTGWLPLKLSAISSNNLSSLPIDPINNTIGGVTYAYAFSCHVDLGAYELATKLESTSSMATDGGNRNDCGTVASSTCLYEVGSKKDLY